MELLHLNLVNEKEITLLLRKERITKLINNL